MAIDFSLAPAVAENLPALAARGISVVIGTTGWQAHEGDMRAVAARAGIGVLASANFSLGMQIFQLAVQTAAKKFADRGDVDLNGRGRLAGCDRRVRERDLAPSPDLRCTRRSGSAINGGAVGWHAPRFLFLAPAQAVRGKPTRLSNTVVFSRCSLPHTMRTKTE
jgi:hypothetical protein